MFLVFWLISSMPAFADSCKFEAIEFDFVSDSNLNRSLQIKGGEKFALPKIGEYPINLNQTLEGKGSLCRNASVFAVSPNQAALLLETLEPDKPATYMTVFDFSKKTMSAPVEIESVAGLPTEKAEEGFVYLASMRIVEGEFSTKGQGPAAGLEMVRINPEIWMRVRWKGDSFETKLDRDITWKNSQLAKYFPSRADFEKQLRLKDSSQAQKVAVFSVFSREAKKDCIQIEYLKDRKTYCRPIKSNR